MEIQTLASNISLRKKYLLKVYLLIKKFFSHTKILIKFPNIYIKTGSSFIYNLLNFNGKNSDFNHVFPYFK